MNTYLETALSFLESEEMRDYLRTRTDWMDRRDCAELVSYAPATLEKKLVALELIAEGYEPELEKYLNPALMTKATRTALNERYDNVPPGTVFRLETNRYSKQCEDNLIFATFDAAQNYIKDYQEAIREWEKDGQSKDGFGYVSHEIVKHVPGDKGKYENYCSWTLNALCEIWYFDYFPETEPEDWPQLYNSIGDLSLPVPFVPGDIIVVDCRPFAKERRVLIVDVGDNMDCCALQCLFVLPNGNFFAGAFNHSAFLRGESSPVSGHYRAMRWEGELSKDEAPFAALSKAIKASPELGRELLDFIHEWSDFERPWRHDRWENGISWKLLRKELSC